MAANVKRNFYADHLVEINKTNPVITSQDICNSLGAIVIAKGARITEEVANKISRFNLELPIELQVNMAVSISPNDLFNDIKEVQAQVLDSKQAMTATKELIKQCGLLNAFPLVSQKLTVFEERMPLKYTETQSVAGFAVLIALQLGLNSSIIAVIFAAAQMHEAGFLNIDPSDETNFNSYSDDKKRAIYKEQLNFGKNFLDRVPNLPKAVGVSVLVHQERKDGSGWPEGIIGDQNSLESQVVGMAVLLHEAYSKSLKPRGFNRSHLIPLIEIQSESFNIDVYHAAVEMLRQGAHKSAQVIPYEFMPSLANYLVVLQRTLQHWFELAKNFSREMNGALKDKADERSLLMISCLEQLYNNSGIWENGLGQWLSDMAVNMTVNEREEIETIALMFEAVIQKLKCLQRSMHVTALSLGGEWVERSNELSVLLYSLPKDHFEAFDKFDCFYC